MIGKRGEINKEDVGGYSTTIKGGSTSKIVERILFGRGLLCCPSKFFLGGENFYLMRDSSLTEEGNVFLRVLLHQKLSALSTEAKKSGKRKGKGPIIFSRTSP